MEGVNKKNEGWKSNMRIEDNEQIKDICETVERLVKEKNFSAAINLGPQNIEFKGNFLRCHTDTESIVIKLPESATAYYKLYLRLLDISKRAGVEIFVCKDLDKASGGGSYEIGNLDKYLKKINKKTD